MLRCLLPILPFVYSTSTLQNPHHLPHCSRSFQPRASIINYFTQLPHPYSSIDSKMRPFPLSLLLIAAPLSSAKNPASWGVQMLPSTIINTSMMRDRSPSILVSGNANNVPKLNDIIGTCKNQQGSIVPKSECQSSVLSVGMSMGLAVVRAPISLLPIAPSTFLRWCRCSDS